MRVPPRTVPTATEWRAIVLIRHGEAACNVGGVVGGHQGCTGLTDLADARSRRWPTAVRDGGAREASALYVWACPVPSRRRTGADAWSETVPCTRSGAPTCDLCELHPGEADGMAWEEVAPPTASPIGTATRTPMAPGGESWSEFVRRASKAVRRGASAPWRARGDRGHAGVIEATMISFLGVSPEVYRRGWLRIVHASMTEWEWEPGEDRWVLLRFNDACDIPRT